MTNSNRWSAAAQTVKAGIEAVRASFCHEPPEVKYAHGVLFHESQNMATRIGPKWQDEIFVHHSYRIARINTILARGIEFQRSRRLVAEYAPLFPHRDHE